MARTFAYKQKTDITWFTPQISITQVAGYEKRVRHTIRCCGCEPHGKTFRRTAALDENLRAYPSGPLTVIVDFAYASGRNTLSTDHVFYFKDRLLL